MINVFMLTFFLSAGLSLIITSVSTRLTLPGLFGVVAGSAFISTAAGILYQTAYSI